MILIGLLSCTALLAGTRLMPAPSRTGMCKAIEIVTGGAGRKSSFYTFRAIGELYQWSIRDGVLVIENGVTGRAELAKNTIEIFNCQLPDS